MKFSTDVNRNGGAGLEGPVAVLEARVWSGLGILERLTLDLGGFSISFFVFPPLVVPGEGVGVSGQALRVDMIVIFHGLVKRGRAFAVWGGLVMRGKPRG